MTSVSFHDSVRLRDGRRLGYHVLGDASGEPVVAIDGIGVRWMLMFGPRSAARTGSRLIVIDRPGYGVSDPDPRGDDLSGLAEDVNYLLDQLGLTRVYLMSAFTGCRYALGLAAGFGHRALGLSLINPSVPWLSNHLPNTFSSTSNHGEVHEQLRRFRIHPGTTLDDWTQSASYEDRQILRDPWVRRIVVDELVAATRDPLAVAAEVAQQSSLPAVDFGSIACQTTVWHGLDDRFHPWEASRALVASLPEANLVSIPDASALWFLTEENISVSP